MKTTNDGKKILEPGDRIQCKGMTCTIADIAYQEYWEGSGFIAEFTDTTGRYRSWKQYIDGGEVMQAEKKYYAVTFQYSESVYCSNIAAAKTRTAVEEYYGNRYGWCKVRECAEWELDEAKRKGKPIVEIPERAEKKEEKTCVRWKKK